jgi:hypothetical protein
MQIPNNFGFSQKWMVKFIFLTIVMHVFYFFLSSFSQLLLCKKHLLFKVDTMFSKFPTCKNFYFTCISKKNIYFYYFFFL